MAEVRFLKISGGSHQRHDVQNDSIRVYSLGVGTGPPTTGLELISNFSSYGVVDATLDITAGRNTAMGAGDTLAGVYVRQGGYTGDSSTSERVGYRVIFAEPLGSADKIGILVEHSNDPPDFTLLCRNHALRIASETTTGDGYAASVESGDASGADYDGGGGGFTGGTAGAPTTVSTYGGDLVVWAGGGVPGPAHAGSGVASYGGDLSLRAGHSYVSSSVGSGGIGADGGEVRIQAGSGSKVGTGQANGGDILLTTGSADGDGDDGDIICRVGTEANAPNIVPYADGYGNIGDSTHSWSLGYINVLRTNIVEIANDGTISWSSSSPASANAGELNMNATTGVPTIYVASKSAEKDLMYEGYPGHWERLVEVELSTSVTSYTFSGLNGNVDINYMIEGFLVASSTSGSYFYIAPNNVTTNQRCAILEGTETAVNAGASIYMRVAGAPSTIQRVVFRALLHAKTGRYRAMNSICGGGNASTGTNNTVNYHFGSRWADSSTNITSLVLYSSVANGLVTNTQLRLYKMGA